MPPSKTTDLHVVSNTPLPPPRALRQELPANAAQAEFVAASRDEIQNILFGEDSRFLVIVGPCSIHDVTAGREYAERLRALADKVRDRMLLVMRVYFEKPRTTVGWKGLIMDPQLDGTNDLPSGLRLARSFLREVIDIGLPTATELLDPITPQYIADLVSWAAIGARTTESQTHRQMASGLSMPLGFKNTTSGDVMAAINAIKAANQSQSFLGINEEGVASAVSTRGNPNCHIILRGGEMGPNFATSHIADTEALLRKNGLPAAIMVDASHANCGKDHRQMPGVFESIAAQRAGGAASVIGAMLESNLLAGNQAFPAPKAELTYGQSITDKCIDWETTERLLLNLRL
ncbi:MAG: 3-deoxy-7-phosphoheptulonate synthase [Verrucomicrobiales bacterium]|nr:3-deoxy-7-phosphoheptulonate synthase [Verrucomicrobiales bacterium]